MGSTPELTKFLYTSNLNNFFAVYNDVASLLVRSLNSNVDTFAASYHSPTFKSLNIAGYTCACFNADQSMLYILDTNEDLVGYNIALGTISTVAYAGESNVIDCCFNGTKNALIIVREGIDMKEFSMASLSVIDGHSTSHQSFALPCTPLGYMRHFMKGTSWTFIWLERLLLLPVRVTTFMMLALWAALRVLLAVWCVNSKNCSVCASDYILVLVER